MVPQATDIRGNLWQGAGQTKPQILTSLATFLGHAKYFLFWPEYSHWSLKCAPSCFCKLNSWCYNVQSVSSNKDTSTTLVTGAPRLQYLYLQKVLSSDDGYPVYKSFHEHKRVCTSVDLSPKISVKRRAAVPEWHGDDKCITTAIWDKPRPYSKQDPNT